MRSPVNTSIDEFIRRKFRLNTTNSNKGVSIITCTNVIESLNNILANFNRQEYLEKELIIIINNNEIDLDNWKNRTKENNNIRIFKLDQDITLGKCLNFGVKEAKYSIIAKFDDDDYYGPKYLSDSIKCFDNNNTKLIGKHTVYVYFTKEKILAIKDIDNENQFIYFLNGATMIFKKDIFQKVRFRDVSVNEDTLFCKDCMKKRITPYSGNKNHFVYLRRPNANSHTWKISNQSLINLYCKIIGNVDDFKPYIDI